MKEEGASYSEDYQSVRRLVGDVRGQGISIKVPKGFQFIQVLSEEFQGDREIETVSKRFPKRSCRGRSFYSVSMGTMGFQDLRSSFSRLRDNSFQNFQVG